MSEIEQEEKPIRKPGEIRREVFTIRPTTTTREAIRLTVSQRENDNKELALASWVLSGSIPIYGEKPDLLEDIGRLFFVAAYYIRKWNRYVKNGK